MNVVADITMGETSGLERILFQTLGVFSGTFSVGEKIWEEYQSFAIPRMEEGTSKLKEILPFISILTPDIATRDLEFIKAISMVISSSQRQIESIEDADFYRFRKTALDFFQTLIDVKSELQKAANQGDNVRASFHYMSRHHQNPAFAKYVKDAPSA